MWLLSSLIDSSKNITASMIKTCVPNVAIAKVKLLFIHIVNEFCKHNKIKSIFITVLNIVKRER